jgi:hypothetical protein
MRIGLPGRLSTLLTVTLGVALISSRVARGQELSVGARVRVSAPALEIDSRTGVLTRVTPDSLSISFRGDPSSLVIAFDRVSQLDVSVGKNRVIGFLRGATVGTLFGALAGIGVGALMVSRCTPAPDGMPCGIVYIATLPIGTGVGLIAGGIIGAVKAPDRWEDVSLPRGGDGLGMRGAISPMRLGLSISF